MKSEEKTKLEAQVQLNKVFKDFVEQIEQLVAKPSSVSFQLAYDNVYKLSKGRRQAEMLDFLSHTIATFLKQRLTGHPDLKLSQIRFELREARDLSERIAEICLFLDVNYCQKILRQPLTQKFNSWIFSSLAASEKFVKKIAQQAFAARIEENTEFNLFCKEMAEVDEKQAFFEQCLLPHYLPLLGEFFAGAAKKAWDSGSKHKYIEWCKFQLQEEESYIVERLARKKGEEGVEAVVASVYQAIVGAYKGRIYQEDQESLFEELTVPLLELLRFGKGKEVEGHIQWFMKVLEEKLNKISTERNLEFIESFYNLHQKVGFLLKGTQSKFDINYRSSFTFEEWLNNEKFNIPLRLNLFIHEHLSNPSQPSDFARTISKVFRFVKEKKIFEGIYRKMLIDRLVASYLDYDPSKEDAIIEAMSKECGEDWTKDIKAISQLFLKDRARFIQARALTDLSPQSNRTVGGLVPLIIPEDSWPFGDKNSKVHLHPQLTQLSSPFEQYYLPSLAKQRLWWTTRAGTVLLDISFGSFKRMFWVSVDMANLLLALDSQPQKLSHFICENGYSMDEVEGFVQALINSKLISSEAEGSDYRLALSCSYGEGGVVDLVREGNKEVEVKAMEELKADRKFMVEAILVKIMKGAKLCQRQELIERSVPFVTQRGFKFNEDFIQHSIDRLVDKEFIRDFEDGNLGYIA